MSEKNKISKKVLWTRIVCAFLAFLMVASVAYLSIQLIVESVKANKAKKEAEAAKTATVTTIKDQAGIVTLENESPVVTINT